ncbi:MAG TPA: hypothetical protein VNF75_05915 [Candidatus Dormibacteraeota bacterium]|nr:hypothetical protein [Candidatus Dormibacteraeota bacterium]
MTVQNADEMAGAVRSAWLAAAAAVVVVVVAGLLIAGLEGAGLALAGGLVGIGNLQLAVFALKRSPIAFLGSSLPRLAVITVGLAALVVALGPIGIWALLGLLVTHLAQVGAVLRLGMRMSSR